MWFDQVTDREWRLVGGCNGASGRFNALDGSGGGVAELKVDRNIECLELGGTLAENLDAGLDPGERTTVVERLHGYRLRGIDLASFNVVSYLSQIDNLVANIEAPLSPEPSLGQPPMLAALAAFKGDRDSAAGARVSALVSTCRCLALATSRAAADADFLAPRAWVVPYVLRVEGQELLRRLLAIDERRESESCRIVEGEQ